MATCLRILWVVVSFVVVVEVMVVMMTVGMVVVEVWLFVQRLAECCRTAGRLIIVASVEVSGRLVRAVL